MRVTGDYGIRLASINRLISSIGSDGFSIDLFSYFNMLAPIDHCAVFVVSDDGGPRTLLTEGHDDCARSIASELAHDYVSGQFVNDPFLNEDGRGGHNRSICGTLAAQAFLPSEMPASAYRRRFYDNPRISHEINMMGRIGSDRLYLCLYRRIESFFTKRDIAAVDVHAPLAINAASKHFVQATRELGPTHKPLALGQRERLLCRLRSDLELTGLLSPREADVCAHIALGYKIDAISLIMGISKNTVSTHRKRAYAKLAISSQNELFARYIDMAGYRAH